MFLGSICRGWPSYIASGCEYIQWTLADSEEGRSAIIRVLSEAADPLPHKTSILWRNT